MRSEKIAVRVPPKFAAELRKIARREHHDTLSSWLRWLLRREVERTNEARKEAV